MAVVLERDPVPDARIAFQVTDKWERLRIAFDEVVALARGLGNVRALASEQILLGNRIEEAFARALRAACWRDRRMAQLLPSTKGVL